MTEQVDVTGAGMDPGRVARVVARFRRQQEQGVFPGGQLVVLRRGRLVVDEAVGVARGLRADEGEPRLEFTPERRSGLFSAGKPLVAIAVAILDQRGAIEVERPVSYYWPEFGRAGKAPITILDILLHRSGLFLWEIEGDWRRFGDWELIMARIAAAEPAFARGTLAYQPMGFGWILGELIRRVTGQRIELFLQEEVLRPAGIDDLRLGVPSEEVASLARAYWVDEQPPTLGGRALVGFEQAQNSVEQLTAVLPGAGPSGRRGRWRASMPGSSKARRLGAALGCSPGRRSRNTSRRRRAGQTGRCAFPWCSAGASASAGSGRTPTAGGERARASDTPATSARWPGQTRPPDARSRPSRTATARRRRS